MGHLIPVGLPNESLLVESDASGGFEIERYASLWAVALHSQRNAAWESSPRLRDYCIPQFLLFGHAPLD